jgi:putative phosphoesterase
MDLGSVRLNLPPKTVVEAEGHRIGLIHGHHVPNPNQVLPPPVDFEAMHRYLLSEFRTEKADCIVYGHTHQAHIGTYRKTLMINPGSVTQGRGGQSTVGLLTISRDQLQGEIIRLV